MKRLLALTALTLALTTVTAPVAWWVFFDLGPVGACWVCAALAACWLVVFVAEDVTRQPVPVRAEWVVAA